MVYVTLSLCDADTLPHSPALFYSVLSAVENAEKRRTIVAMFKFLNDIFISDPNMAIRFISFVFHFDICYLFSAKNGADQA